MCSGCVSLTGGALDRYVAALAAWSEGQRDDPPRPVDFREEEPRE